MGKVAVCGVVCIKVSGFETVNGDGVFTTLDIDCEVLIRSFDESIIWWLKCLVDSIMTCVAVDKPSTMLLFR